MPMGKHSIFCEACIIFAFCVALCGIGSRVGTSTSSVSISMY